MFTPTIHHLISDDNRAFAFFPISYIVSLRMNSFRFLQEPIITEDDIEVILKDLDDPIKAFEQLDRVR